MCISKVIGNLSLLPEERAELLELGVSYIATENPTSRSDETEIINRVGNAEAIIINISTPITKNVMHACRNLKFIQTWSTGVDNIDLECAKNLEIIVKNVPDFSVDSVAEKTLCMMIFVANKMREANNDVLSGNWNYTGFQGVELKNKTLGIIGGGKIGTRVGKLSQAFGMKFITANSKTNRNELKDLLSKSDFVTIHCPLTKSTYHLIDKLEFKAMKKGVYFINNSRGGVVNEQELLNALDEEIISYASVDVFEKEPPKIENSLIHHPRVFVTPHIAWHTKESNKRLTRECIENLKNYIHATKFN